jgi:hypothetical protein
VLMFREIALAIEPCGLRGSYCQFLRFLARHNVLLLAGVVAPP